MSWIGLRQCTGKQSEGRAYLLCVRSATSSSGSCSPRSSGSSSSSFAAHPSTVSVSGRGVPTPSAAPPAAAAPSRPVFLCLVVAPSAVVLRLGEGLRLRGPPQRGLLRVGTSVSWQDSCLRRLLEAARMDRESSRSSCSGR